MKKRLPVLLLLALCLSPCIAVAQDFVADTPEFPSARLQALGGTHAALAADITVLFTNPAAFRSVTPQLSVSELSVNLTGPVFSIADLVMRIVGGSDPLALLSDAKVQKLLTSLYAAGTLDGPLSFGYVGNGLGFGFFNSSGVSFATQGTVPTVTASVHEDLEFVGGYAFRIDMPSIQSTLDLGVSMKAIASGSVSLDQSILGIFSLITSQSASTLLSQPLVLDVGFGVDAGLLYTWSSVLSVGIVGRDLYTPVVRNTYASVSAFQAGQVPTPSYGLAPIDLDAGVLFTPKLGVMQEYLSGLKFMLDYGDILDFLTHPATAKNPLLHIGLGAELTALDILSLRAGFGQGYFSAGVGLDLTAFQLSLSMYGSELSLEPGLRPAYNLLAGFEFRY